MNFPHLWYSQTLGSFHSSMLMLPAVSQINPNLLFLQAYHDFKMQINIIPY